MSNIIEEIWENRKSFAYCIETDEDVMFDTHFIGISQFLQAAAELCQRQRESDAKKAEDYITNYENLLHDYHLQELKKEILNNKLEAE
jgi:hypothetical protein